jgi:hypothetical protein
MLGAVLLAGLSVLSVTLGYTVKMVAKAVSDVGTALINPPPHPEPERPARAPGHEEDRDPSSAGEMYLPPWEVFDTPGAETKPGARDGGDMGGYTPPGEG